MRGIGIGSNAIAHGGQRLCQRLPVGPTATLWLCVKWEHGEHLARECFPLRAAGESRRRCKRALNRSGKQTASIDTPSLESVVASGLERCGVHRRGKASRRRDC